MPVLPHCSGCACAFVQGDLALWQRIQSEVGPDEHQFLLSVMIRMFLHNSAQFNRRVTRPLQQYPFKLIWLVASGPDEPCNIRRTCAKELLDADINSLEVNTKKIRKKFENDLRQSETTGCLCHQLYWLLKGVTKMLKPDVRANEGLNKYLTLLDERSPNCSVELRSSRLGLRYLLGEHGYGKGMTRWKWSKFQPVAELVREECLSSWQDVVGVQSNPFRWIPNAAAADLPSPAVLTKEFNHLKPHLSCATVRYTWAASYNMIVHKNLQEENSIYPTVLCISERGPGEQKSTFHFWISAGKIRKKHIVCPAGSTYMMDNGQKHKVVFVTDLTDFRPFVKAIEDQFLKVKDNFHIAISQIFVKKALESEECRTLLSGAASSQTQPGSSTSLGLLVHKTKALVRLQKPTATFLKQCAKSGLSHEADKADKPASFEASKEDSSNSSSSSVEKDNEHTTNNQPADEDQIFGLNLLAEEAEAISGQPESDSELDNDKSSDDPSLHLLCKGLAATFHPTEFNDDDAVEARVSEVMNSEVQSHVADTHERTIAFESVKNNNCDNLLNQEQMNQLQNPDMDFIDAAVETCVTLAAGLPMDSMDGILNHESAATYKVVFWYS